MEAHAEVLEGLSWEQFLADWCLGVAPLQSPVEVARAFGALARRTPDRLKAFQDLNKRGIAEVAPLVALGLAIAAIEHLPNFDGMLHRLNDGQAPAEAEIKVAAALQELSLSPVLEPPLGTRVLDAMVEVEGRLVYIEVISPATSDEMVEARTATLALAEQVVSREDGTHTELMLLEPPTGSHDVHLAAIDDTPVDGVTHEVEGLGLIQRRSLVPGATPDLSGRIPRLDDKPVLGAATVRTDGARVSCSVTVRFCLSDERTHRLLMKELKHFSPSEANVIVVCVSGVIGGLKYWVPLVERWFQPDRNTRVGAVALYEEVLEGEPTAVRQHWRVLANPHAAVPVPPSLLEALASLNDEPSVL